MKTFWKSFTNEFKDRVCSNKKRIVKFIAICFVPFLYGFFCVWAFWNPFSKIDQIPMAIINQDQGVCLGWTDDTKQLSDVGNDNLYTLTDITNKASFEEKNKTLSVKPIEITDKNSKVVTIKKIQWINLIDDAIATKIKNNTLLLDTGNLKAKLEYLTKKPSDDNKYWVQLKTPGSFSEHLVRLLAMVEHINILDLAQTKDKIESQLAWFKDNKIEFFSSYRHNFLAGHFMYIFTQFKDGVMVKLMPHMLFDLMTNMFKDSNHILKKTVLEQYIQKLTKVLGYASSFGGMAGLGKDQITTIKNINNSLKTVLPAIIDRIFVDDAGNKVNEINLDHNASIDKIKEKILNTAHDLLTGFVPINATIQGVNNNEYGVGLGQFFICIAIWIGCLMQTFIYDREKRTKKANHVQHYFSKWLLMWITALIQTTLLSLSLLTLNFHKIGTSFGLLYLWMLFAVTIFITVQQAIWFAFKDGDIGKFIIIVYLIINLSSGWGTFPAFMQANLFNVLSYIAPFTYVLHAMGDIVYGIASPVGIGIGVYQTDILTNLAILLIWPIIFITLGLFTSYLHAKKDRFGTISNKKIYQVLTINNNLTNFIDNDKKHINFKAIDEQTSNIIKQTYLENFAKKTKLKSEKPKT